MAWGIRCVAQPSAVLIHPGLGGASAPVSDSSSSESMNSHAYSTAMLTAQPEFRAIGLEMQHTSLSSVFAPCDRADMFSHLPSSDC